MTADRSEVGRLQRHRPAQFALDAINYYARLPALQALVRPIYIRKGIIPEMADGLTAANRMNTAAEE